jgi:hypothetical protein
LSSDSVVSSLLAGAAPASQDIDVTAGNTTAVSGLAVLDSGVVAGQSTWLTATLSSTTAPAKLTVHLSPTSVLAGRYEATLRISAHNAQTRAIRVALVVRPHPQLSLDRSTVDLSGDVGASFESIVVNLKGNNGAIDSLSVSKADCGSGPTNWIAASLSPTSVPAALRFTFATSSLNAGTYACSFTVSTSQALVDSASRVVRVSLVLRGVPRIALSADTLKFLVYRLSESAPTSVSITNSGSGTLSDLSLGTVAYGPGGTGWLTLALSETTAPATLSVTANAAALSPGQYVATVPVQSSAEGVAASSKSLVVNLTVVPRPSSLIAIPNVVNLTVPAGGSALTYIVVTHSGDIPLRHVAFGQFPSPPLPWLNLAIGCTGDDFFTPCTALIRAVPPGGLTPGVYTSQVLYKAYDDNLTTTVTVKVTVTP